MTPRLIQFVFQQAEMQPLSDRIRIYRDLAAEIRDAEERQALIKLTEGLEVAQEQALELQLTFHRLAS